MLEFIVEVAKAAGAEALKYFGHLAPSDVQGKATSKDLVSVADKAVERFIIDRITSRFPDHAFFGEESGHIGNKSPYCWVIDPIDGTQSFVQNHPYFSISIALYREGKALAGVVNAPALDRLFSAAAGEGAWLNGVGIRVSRCAELSEAACATGFALLRENRVERTLERFNRVLPHLRDIKRCGSAALDLGFTAAGIYDAYWEDGLKLYDVAAGVLIAREAGARVCDFDGGEDIPARGVIAGSPAIVGALQKLIAM